MPKVVHRGFNPWGVEDEDSPILQGPSVTHYDRVTYSNTLEGPKLGTPFALGQAREGCTVTLIYTSAATS